jgi:hypothetical protein
MIKSLVSVKGVTLVRKILTVLAVLFISCNLLSQSADVRGIWNPNPPSDSVDYYQAEWFQANNPDTSTLTIPDTVMIETDTMTTTRFTVDSNYVFLRIRAHNSNGFGAYSDWSLHPRGEFAVPGKVTTNQAAIIRWED